MNRPVTKVTRGTLDADITVENGDTIWVAGIIFANSSLSPVEIDLQTPVGSTVYGTITVPGEDSRLIEFPFLADKGLQIDAVPAVGASVVATVFHSAAGV